MIAPPPLRPASGESHAVAQRAVKRGAGLARVSAVCLIVAGVLSVLLCLLNPVSIGMLVSLAVLVNGIIEWYFAGRLRALQVGAVNVLALNQVALGAEIGLYAAWRAHNLDMAMIETVLQRPTVVTALQLYPPDQVALLREMLPVLVRGGLLAGGAAAMLGCVIMALYYRSRSRHLARLASPAART